MGHPKDGATANEAEQDPTHEPVDARGFTGRVLSKAYIPLHKPVTASVALAQGEYEQ